MIESIIIVCVLINLVLLIIQDYRSRSIHLFALGSYLILALIYWFNVGMGFLATGLNLGYLGLLFGLSAVVLKVGRGKAFGQFVGLGDVLFIAITALYFGFTSFIIWLNLGLILALAGHLVLGILNPGKKLNHRLIPLVSYLGLVFGLGLVIEQWYGSVGMLVGLGGT